MRLSIKDILNNIPNGGVRNKNGLDLVKVKVEPYISGYFHVKFNLPDFFKNIEGSTQYNIISNMKKFDEEIQTTIKGIKKYRTKFGYNWIANFIESVEGSDFESNIVQNRKVGFSEAYAGSTSKGSQTITVNFKLDEDLIIWRMFKIWNDILYHPFLGFSLLKSEYYHFTKYGGYCAITSYKPNMLDEIIEKEFKYLIPLSNNEILKNLTLESASISKLSMNFAYILSI